MHFLYDNFIATKLSNIFDCSDNYSKILAHHFLAANSTNNFEMYFLFGTALSTTLSHIAYNDQRLCEGGAYTNVHAGYKFSFSHCFFCGVTAPLSQNRTLYVGIFPKFTPYFPCQCIFESVLLVKLNLTY